MLADTIREAFLDVEVLAPVREMHLLQWDDIAACFGEDAGLKFAMSARYHRNFEYHSNDWTVNRNTDLMLRRGPDDRLLNSVMRGDCQTALSILRSAHQPPSFLRNLSLYILRMGYIEFLTQSSTATNQRPLHIAADTGLEAVAERLVEIGAALDLPDMLGHTPLYLAAAKGQINTARTLIQAGADINRTGLAKWSPLLAAARMGHTGMVRLLAEQDGINLQHLDGCERNAAAHAVLGGHPETFQYLLERGIDITVVDASKSDLATLIKHSRSPHRMEMQEMLSSAEVRWGALLAAGKDPRGNNLLDPEAVSETAIYTLLTDRKTSPAIYRAASMLQMARDGYTAPSPDSPEGLMLEAMERNDGQSVRSIAANQCTLNPGFNINARNAAGLTVLFMATQRRDYSLVTFALNRQADPNIGNAVGVTPLMQAVENDDVTTASVFLDCTRTDPTVTDKQGRSALTRAEGTSQCTLVFRLRQAETAWKTRQAQPAISKVA